MLRATVEHRITNTITWSRVIFVCWPSLTVFTDMRLDPDYIEAQKHRVESAESHSNLVTLKRES
jgi:uncharacterized protein (DUF1330 family)